MAFIAVITLLTGILYPPNTWDSMTYHMSKIMHWIQNHSVAPYPTNCVRQLYLAPFSEFVILQFQLLLNNDYLANIVQWVSMLGSVAGVSLIAKEFGASVRGQIFAALVCATIPIGIIESSSTQTDYVITFFIVGLILSILKFIKENKFKYLLMIGATLGLSILTKGTAYIYAAPFMAYFGFILLKQNRLKEFIKAFSVITIIVLTINAGHLARNYYVFNTFLTPASEKKYVYNEKITPALFISNVVRNISNHIGTGSSDINVYIYKKIEDFHKLIGVDINDRNTTFPKENFRIFGINYSETLAGNFWHLILVFLSLGLLLLSPVKNKKILVYSGLCISTFILFSLLLKWQPWATRLELTFFVISSAFIGITLADIKYKKIVNLLIIFLMLTSIPPLLLCYQRNFLQYLINSPTREESYFTDRYVMQEIYFSMADYVKKILAWILVQIPMNTLSGYY